MAVDRRPVLVVATFHRVGDGQVITAGKMKEHFEVLARHFEIIGPREFLAGNAPKRAAMISVDDGHQDIYECMYPVASEMKLPVTVCVATDYVVRRSWLWFDLLEWIFSNGKEGAEAAWDGVRLNPGQRQTLADAKRTIKRFGKQRREETLSQLAGQLGLKVPSAPYGGYAPFSVEQMREMVRSGTVQICAHTVTHTIATVLGDGELRDELSGCKAELEALVECPVVGFCYPNGNAGDFDARTTAAVKAAGYRMALTSIEGVNPMPNLDLFQIKRVHAHADLVAFEKEIAGIGGIQRMLGLGEEQ